MKESALGKPVIVYHGTKVAFDKFDFDKAADGAHFFTPIKEHAEHFGNVKAYRIVIDNPLVISQDDLEAEWDKEHPDGEQDDRHLLPRDFIDEFVLQAKAKEHDGLIIERFADLDFQTTVYLPFSPEQIHNAELVSEQTIDIEGRQSMKERNTLEAIVYAQATTQMLSHSSSFKHALDALDYLGHCVKKHIEPIGLVRKAPFETMDWPHVHDYVQSIATQNIGTMKNLLDLAHKGVIDAAIEGELDSDMNQLDLEYMIDRGNVLDAIEVPQSIAPGISSPKYTDKALAAARGDVIVPLGDLKAVAYVDDESGAPAIKAQSPAVFEDLYKRSISPGTIVLNQDKPMGVDTWFFDLDDIDASFSELTRVLKRLDVANAESVLTELKAIMDQPISQTIDDAKLMVGDALAKVNLPAPVWRRSTGSATPWEYTDVDVGSYRPLVIGASAGGVVSVDGDPFTPDTRELNVSSTRILKSLETGIQSLQRVQNAQQQQQVVGSNHFKIEEHRLIKNGREYFSFSALIPGDKSFTNWMTIVDGVLHDANWVEDDTYDGNEVIPTSPVVNITAPVDSVNDHLRPVLHQMFLTAISEKVGFSVDVPMLCEARDAEKIAALKMAAGYSWDASTQEYLKDNNKEKSETATETATSLINVALSDTRTAAFTDIGKQAEAVRILREAAKFIRDNDVYEGVALHDVNGNKVGAVHTGRGNMSQDIYAVFANPGDSNEVARLIDDVANNVEKGVTVFYLYDLDGNNIGQATTAEWEEDKTYADDDAAHEMNI